MIERIHIKNFKSIYDLDINVGRINLFIGENGSGKSNLLEALVFVSASQSNKLDNEFLVLRGIRVTEPVLMRSAFKEETKDKDIEIIIYDTDNNGIEYNFYNGNSDYSKWDQVFKILDDNSELVKLSNDGNSLRNDHEIENFISKLTSNDIIGLRNLWKNIPINNKINDFLIYSPENTALRIFYKEGQIEPLGINGEGLLKLLKVVNNYKDKSYINTIIESLQLFDWFGDIKISDEFSFGEQKLIIKDKYLYKEIDQRSTNEGFLFILFYITLIVAKETPKAFAIDNIDASLNPKLCTKLMTIICDLAKKYDKQIFLTTHNPAILDGIDLNDEEQKLFVVSRNKSGHTRMKNITAKDKPKSSNDEPLKLSEAFLRGYLGGLPKGF